MSGHGEKFSRKKEAAATALVTQRTAEDAAQLVGIGPATLRRWQKEPEFDAAYRAAKRAAYGQSIARLQQLLDRPKHRSQIPETGTDRETDIGASVA